MGNCGDPTSNEFNNNTRDLRFKEERMPDKKMAARAKEADQL